MEPSHQDSLKREEKHREAVADAQREAGEDSEPANLPVEIVAAWLEAMGRPTCVLQKALITWPGTDMLATLPALEVALAAVSAWWFDWANTEGNAYDDGVAKLKASIEPRRRGLFGSS